MDYSRIENGLAALGYLPIRNNASDPTDRAEIAKFFRDFANSFGDRPTQQDILAGRVSWIEIEAALETIIIARTRYALQNNPPSNRFEIERHQQRLEWLGFYEGEIDGLNGPLTRRGNAQFLEGFASAEPAAAPPAPARVQPVSTRTPEPPRVTRQAPSVPRRPLNDEEFTVYLDPGHGFWHHGWYDGGTEHEHRGRTVYESDIVLQHAREIARELEERGIRVVMIRDDVENIGRRPGQRVDREGDGVEMDHENQSLGLRYRTRQAVRDMRANDGRGIYISLHADAAENESASRISIRHLQGAERGQEFAQLLAREFNTDGVQQAANGGTDAVVRSNRYQVLRETQSSGLPAVLVELGFMSNREDLGRLTSPWQRSNTANQFADAIERYIGD